MSQLHQHAEYDVLIRAFNSAQTIAAVLAGMKKQSISAKNIIVVDSGSTDATVQICIDHGCKIVDYGPEPFNYSKSLNIGFRAAQAPFVWVLSSHVIVNDENLSLKMIRCLEDLGHAACSAHCDGEPGVVQSIDSRNFSQFLALHNPCAMYSRNIVLPIGFDEKIPTCEDIALTRQLITCGNKVCRLNGASFAYKNPNVSRRKTRNEYMAVSAFLFRENLNLLNIGRFLFFGMRSLLVLNTENAWHCYILAARLFIARYRNPTFNSRYF